MSAEERPPMSATRRALFAGSIALGAFPAASKTQNLMELWREYRRVDAQINATNFDEDDALDKACCQLDRIEDLIMGAPLHNKDDAIAKLMIAAMSLEKGNRADKSDLKTVEQIARWLEA